MLKKVYSLAILGVMVLVLGSWRRPYYVFPNTQKDWVDSVYQSLTLDEKLGQLFMVAAYSNKGNNHEQEILNLIENYHVGGLIFFQGGPHRQIRQTNLYQSRSKVPLLIAMDAEWGLNMRLDSTLKFPRQMTLGAIQNDSLIYEMGKSIAEECRALGVHINFAPVVDVNVNPANPVIGTRSFGEDRQNVAQKGIAYMNGMQDNGIIAVAKHFPGHGDTDKDSHVALPVIKHDKKRLKEVELFPFRQMIHHGVKGIMVAHLHIPALDSRKNRATTLSKNVVTNLLKEDLGFEELIFTDALNMKGVSEYNKPGEVDEMAFLAGNDVLLFPEDVPAAIKRLKRSLKRGKISEKRLEESVKKILRAKFRVGLDAFEPISGESVHSKLVNGQRHALIQDLYNAAITLVKNEDEVVPVQQGKYKRIASVSLGVGAQFNLMNSRFEQVDQFTPHTDVDRKSFLSRAEDYDLAIIGLGDLNNSRYRHYGLSAGTIEFIHQLEEKTTVLLAVFGNPYSLANFEDISNLICAYNENEYTLSAVPQSIFGVLPTSGRLPVSAGEYFRSGMGLTASPLKKLGFTTPESQGFNPDTLALIDTLVNEIIQTRAAPGCQVLVARHGKIILEKGYGFFTYEKNKPVDIGSVYDLASITKVAATMQAVMKLHSEGKLQIDDYASEYLTELKGTNKEFMTIKNILLHQAGLQPYLPHWKFTLNPSGNGLSKKFYCDTSDSWFCKAVMEGIYTSPAVRDSIWKWTIASELREPLVEEGKKRKRRRRRKKPNYRAMRFEYKYSDLGFYIMREIVERITKTSLDSFVQYEFYDKMGLKTLTYKPNERYGIAQIPPTTDDQYFRMRVIQGYVHDPGASMMGGVGGHAGLFSNAYDLAQLMQMNLQNGYYDGKTYFSSDTIINYFTKKQVAENRRGLGWDKPFEDGSREGSTSYLASERTFGHSGFTGTCVWVDPQYDLIYVFLSNRTYPEEENARLVKENYRTRIHDIIYRSLGITTPTIEPETEEK